MDEEILKGKTLLIVDDEADLREIVVSELEFMGARAFQAENIQSAQEILLKNHIDLIISDIRMPGGTGIDLLKIVKAKGQTAPPVILITGFADVSIADAFDLGAEALINKPFMLDDLIRLVVRYSSDVDHRFREQIRATRKIELSEPRDIRVGRGGVALSLDSSSQRVEVGEPIEFSVDYRGQHLEGSGVCRWVRTGEPGTNKLFLGLEFMNLSEPSRQALHTLFQGHQSISYIPAM